MSKHFTYPFNPIQWPAEPHDYTGDNVLGIYAVETTQRYVFGTRLITWDGRVYKYAHAVAVVYNYWGAHAYENAIPWAALPSGTDAGQREQIVTLGSRTTDDLAGGYLMINDNSATTTDFLFGIIGNNDTATTTTVYIDSPLPITTTVSDNCEIFENPYRETKAHAAGVCPVVCIPANSCAATYNYWGQTYGPAYISPTNTTLDDPAPEELSVYFSGAGTTGGLVEAAVATNTFAGQHAGFILNCDIASAGGIAGPLIMLQISI
jgi:hypothetical protein